MRVPVSQRFDISRVIVQDDLFNTDAHGVLAWNTHAQLVGLIMAQRPFAMRSIRAANRLGALNYLSSKLSAISNGVVK